MCAVPAAAVVGEAVIARALGGGALERFGGATLEGVTAAVEAPGVAPGGSEGSGAPRRPVRRSGSEREAVNGSIP